MNTSWISVAAWVLQVFVAPAALAAASEQSKSHYPASRSIDQAPSVIFSREFKHAVDVQDYLPLQVGTRWTYLHTDKDAMGPQRTMITVKWVEDVEILGHRETPEGKLILRKTTIRDIVCQAPETARAQDIEWCRQRPERLNRADYVIEGNYVYGVSQDYADQQNLRSGNGNTASPSPFQETCPAFFFPMEKVRVWAERSREEEAMKQARLWEAGQGPSPHIDSYYWHVMGREDVVVPYGRLKDVVHLRYGTLGGPAEVWFKEGIGVVRETIRRSLDYVSRETLLLDFSAPIAR